MARQGKANKQTNKHCRQQNKSIENYPNWNLSEGGGAGKELEKQREKGTDSLSLSLFVCLQVDLLFSPLFALKLREWSTTYLPPSPFLTQKHFEDKQAHTYMMPILPPHLLSISLSQK
jgi:hypothetical protein